MKTFKQYYEESNPTSTANVAGAGDDVADWKYNKKKRKPLTRHYIEVNGKRKRLVK